MSSAPAVPSSAPQIVSVSPSTVEIGSTDDVFITGLNTNFVQGQTTVTVPQGVTVNTVLVLAPTVLGANITVAADAPTGTFPVTVTTGAETETLASAITIAAQGTITPIPLRHPPLKEIDYTIYILFTAECLPAEEGGSGFSIDWTIKGFLCLDLDPTSAPASPVYTPSLAPPSTLQVTVNKWAMQSQGGAEVVLTSPMSYTIQAQVSLDLSAPSPVLSLQFIQPFPFEQTEVQGHTAQMYMFGTMLMTILGLNNLGSNASQAAGGPALTDGNVTDADQAGAAAQSLANSIASSFASFAGSGPAGILGGMIPQGSAQPILPGSPFQLIAGMSSNSNQSVSAPWDVHKDTAKLDLTFSQNGLDIDLNLRVAPGTGSND